MESEKLNEIISRADIATELGKLFEIDQETRKNGPPANLEVDRASTKRLKEIITEIGWPTISKVGEKGSSDAWVLAQHADEDVFFQLVCLNLMKEALPEEVKQDLIAYLEDRVLCNQGKPQVYGTQMIPGEHGVVPKPISHETEVNNRRAALGMETLEDYQKGLNERINARNKQQTD